VDEQHKISVAKGVAVPLKSYRCNSGGENEEFQFRVEYYRLTEVAASLLVNGGSSNMLQKTLNGAKLIPNDVSRTYADLLSRFGASDDVPKNNGEVGTSFEVVPTEDAAATEPPGNDDTTSIADTLTQTKLRTLVGLQDSVGDTYPAVNEIAALRSKSIPDNLKYYYTFSVSDCVKGDFTCKKFGDDTIAFTVWRSMTADDVRNYASNVKTYNNQLLQLRKNKKDAKDDFLQPDGLDTGYYKLASYLSNGQWPADFIPIIGIYQAEDCGTVSPPDLPGLAGWSFQTRIRNVRIDATLIRNLSKRPLTIASLLGQSDPNKTLRVIKPTFAGPENPSALDSTSATITPGQSAIFLTRILFLLADEDVSNFRKFQEAKDAIRTTYGPNGFTGNTAGYEAPEATSYAYGPAIVISGAMVGSQRIDFTAHPVANYIRLTSGSEAGSCPYLLSWDETDHEWLEHGKILHKAHGQDKAYSETLSFPGLRTRFRVVEREPEIARLELPKLTVELADGSVRSLPLRPSQAFNPAMTLYWGDAADIVFSVDGLSSADVVESRLEMSGYYDRYSDRLPHQTASDFTPIPLRVKSPRFYANKYERSAVDSQVDVNSTLLHP
jgi:hypothetical protein